jgi:hypothetical protein
MLWHQSKKGRDCSRPFGLVEDVGYSAAISSASPSCRINSNSRSASSKAAVTSCCTLAAASSGSFQGRTEFPLMSGGCTRVLTQDRALEAPSPERGPAQ